MQNLYAYCGNNPVNFVDPTGHEFSIFKYIKNSIKLVIMAANALKIKSIETISELSRVNDYNNVAAAKKLMVDENYSSEEASKEIKLLPIVTSTGVTPKLYREQITLALDLNINNTFDFGYTGGAVGRGVWNLKCQEVVKATKIGIGILGLLAPPPISGNYSAYGQLAEYFDINSNFDVKVIYGDMR